MRPRSLPLTGAAFAALALLAGPPRAARAQSPSPAGFAVFPPSSECLACHNGLVSPAGEDVSIGTAWRGSMMAQSTRDPYWQAAVRRESTDHPAAAAAIEDECSVCHMPMTRTLARFAGEKGRIFAHLPVGSGTSEESLLAADGVSCSSCHQIRDEKLGTRESFTGGYAVADPGAPRPRPLYGRRQVAAGLAAVMRSSTTFTPAESLHVRDSELCATCHTLITHALDPGGKVVGELPEQVPYLEWRHSAFRGERSCQSCHMPAVEEPAPISAVLGEPREGLARHTFVGGNAFMLRLLNRHRAALGVEAFPHELDAAVVATERQLQSDAASVRIDRVTSGPGRLEIAVAVANRAGHKLPTGYPSRRAWLHLVVRDAEGRTVFESGAVEPSGRIVGNDNDADASAFEPHHAEITSPEEVQVYEAIMADHAGSVTTGLLRGVRYLKDNRLLPRGFDKATAEADVRVHGGARDDADFQGGGDRVRYVVATGGARGPFRVEAELRYQTVAFRWAENFRSYGAEETRRFVSLHESMAASSAVTLARAAADAGPPDPLASILRARPEWFAGVLARAAEHRLQILYTQIDRDAGNRPRFRSFSHGLTDAYFYPASTVKLPAAVLALEKLNDLAVPGLTRDTPLRIEAGTPAQTAVDRDPSKADGFPTIAHYVKKVFLVSDNDAFNRLYEFLGQKEINERLWSRGFPDARILRRLEAALDAEENRLTNPFVFFQGDRVLHRQGLVRNPEAWVVERPEVRQGRGFLRDGKLVEEPMDFRHSNYLSVQTLQGVLRSVLFPEAVSPAERFRLTEDDRRFLYASMSTLPRESAEPAYPDREKYPDSHVKYFLFGGSKAPIPSHVRVFNKVGEAYGYLIDDAYVADFDAGVEFLLTAVIHVNADGIYNDDAYEYEEVGRPFLARLGQAVYEYELGRERPRRPDLSRFRVHT